MYYSTFKGITELFVFFPKIYENSFMKSPHQKFAH